MTPILWILTISNALLWVTVVKLIGKQMVLFRVVEALIGTVGFEEVVKHIDEL